VEPSLDISLHDNEAGICASPLRSPERERERVELSKNKSGRENEKSPKGGFMIQGFVKETSKSWSVV
jgi:hypothetical protein